MQSYTDAIFSTNGPVPNVSVTVNTYPGGVLATLYSDNGVTLRSNPVITGNDGRFLFYAADGNYTLTVSGTGIVTQTVGPILLQDYATVTPIASKLASTSAGLGAYLVGEKGTATGEVATTVGAYLNLMVKGLKKNFGAAADGVTDDSTPIANALASGKIIEAEGGTYLTGSQVLPSNFEMIGWGNDQTIFKAKNSLNAQVFKNSDTASGNVNISLRDFRIEGNSANQSSGDRSGIVFQKVTNGLIKNVLINDMTDWSFGMYQGDYITLKDCIAQAMIGINSSSGIRAGYLFGTTSTLRLANNITVENCVAKDVVQPYVDGFVFEQGTGIIVRGCTAKGVPYSGFKINAAHNVTLIGNTADQCLVGFQKQTYSNNASYIGNLAYKNSSAGFLLGNIDTGNISTSLIVHGNQAIDNGQNAYSAFYGASGVRYGIAFEGTASATQDIISVQDNICLDTGGGTQGRGISFGASGTFSNTFIGGNVCKGNTADYSLGASLQTTTLTKGFNVGLNGSSYDLAWPTSVQRLAYWTDNLAQSSGTVTLSDGFSGRGYQMPRAGYIRSLAVKSNAAITAGNATFQLRINGSIDSTFDTQLNNTHTPFRITETNIQSRTFAAGDMITVSCVGDGTLLPNGTADFDAVVEVAY